MLLRNEKIFRFALLAVLFCFAISLFNWAGYIFVVMVVAMLMLYGRHLRVSTTDLWLFLFSICYFFFYLLHFDVEVNSFIWYCIGPWSAYLLGRVYMNRSQSNNSFMTFLLILSFGMFLHGVLNVIAYLRSDYFLSYAYYRQSVDFWRNELVNVKSTEMLFTFATGLSLGVLFTSYKGKYKFLSAIIVLFSVSCAVLLANRGLLIMTLIVIMWRIFDWIKSHDASLIHKFTLFIVIGALLIVLALLILATTKETSNLLSDLKIFQRFTSEDELTRFDVWNVFLKDSQFIQYPFGGKFITENSTWGYLHNTWLDCYNVVGAIPFAVLIYLTFKFFSAYIYFGKVMRSKNKHEEFIVFQSVLLAALLNMMIEPVIEGNPYFFLTLLMFLGAMNEYTIKLLSEPRQLK